LELLAKWVSDCRGKLYKICCVSSWFGRALGPSNPLEQIGRNKVGDLTIIQGAKRGAGVKYLEYTTEHEITQEA
jgi:hypothetical protein